MILLFSWRTDGTSSFGNLIYYPFSITIKVYTLSKRSEKMKNVMEQLLTAVVWMLRTLLFIISVTLVANALEMVVCTIFYIIWG